MRSTSIAQPLQTQGDPGHCGNDADLQESGFWNRYLEARTPGLLLSASAHNGYREKRSHGASTCIAVNKLLTSATSWFAVLTIARDLGHTFNAVNIATSWNRLGRLAREQQASPSCWCPLVLAPPVSPFSLLAGA